MLRSQATEPFGQEEVPWDGTYEARLDIPAGKRSIEIRIDGNGIVQSGVAPGWNLNVAQAAVVMSRRRLSGTRR